MFYNTYIISNHKFQGNYTLHDEKQNLERTNISMREYKNIYNNNKNNISTHVSLSEQNNIFFEVYCCLRNYIIYRPLL